MSRGAVGGGPLGMRVTIVGCSGSYPGPDSPASCYLVEAEDHERTWRILLDCGNGAIGALHRYADPLTIDAVFLSHLHADHCLDLCGYYVMRKYHPDGPQPRIPVWGPTGTADRMAKAYDLPLDPGMHEEFDFREHAPGAALEVGPFTVTAVAVNHPVEAYGLRVEAGGRVLAYTGDTAACPGLDRLADGAHLLLAEASFRDSDDNPPDIHLTGRECGDVAVRGQVQRMVLTHVAPWHDPQVALREARTTYDGPLALAVPGAVHVV
ncbi:MBL fold metallo-hydrolase [Nocardioides perillae]|uniref:Ribonuclease BN (tRNA processing enzyme) n=1 Tax=Nocardioides perillae TaxID=1119534 RepID=A0A7Y9RXJ5_9ACTN|nr:ribonuclease BN (tRNA processing enzyme) [Nocardioides perillae]